MAVLKRFAKQAVTVTEENKELENNIDEQNRRVRKSGGGRKKPEAEYLV
ncbi:MAG: hypothetical protein LBL70_05800 [Treponema sp.]|jgi:hypothetical protein|nr:hypothetical protein [Treponema sp.]